MQIIRISLKDLLFSPSLNCSFTNPENEGNLTWLVYGVKTNAENDDDDDQSFTLLTLNWDDLGKVSGDVVSVSCRGEVSQDSNNNNTVSSWSSLTEVLSDLINEIAVNA